MFLHRLVQRLRSCALDQIAGAMNWTSDHIIAPAAARSPEIDTWQLRLGWWIDRQLGRAFGWFYPGSDEEERDALDAGIPAKWMSERQRAIALEAFVNPVAHCNECCWAGFIHEAPDYTCPSCGDDGALYWDERSRAWVPYTDRRALAIVPACTLEKGGAR
jgi:hypothetical protein